MRTILSSAVVVNNFVPMSFIVDGRRAELAPEQAARQQAIDAQFFQHQRDEINKPRG
jgi:hypothetical protein